VILSAVIAHPIEEGQNHLFAFLALPGTFNDLIANFGHQELMLCKCQIQMSYYNQIQKTCILPCTSTMHVLIKIVNHVCAFSYYSTMNKCKQKMQLIIF